MIGESFAWLQAISGIGFLLILLGVCIYILIKWIYRKFRKCQ